MEGSNPSATAGVWLNSRSLSHLAFANDELPLFNRAWALQERLLAKRIVHLTPEEMVFECMCGRMCECGRD